jgi:raffinose/stachyose/melibiose transport system substrate-binding protein
MKNALPPDFEMACFPVPVIEGGKGDPNAIYGGGAENFFVFKDARHPKEALDFLKFMLSRQSAQSYIQQLDTLSPVRDAEQGVKVSPALESAIEVVNRRSRLFSDRLSSLYLEFGKATMPDSLAALMKNQMTPEAFARALEAGLDKIRRNSEIYKPPAMGVPAL